MIAAVPGSEYQKACEWIHLPGPKTLLCRQHLKKRKRTETASLLVPLNDLYLVMLLTLNMILAKLTDMHNE